MVCYFKINRGNIGEINRAELIKLIHTDPIQSRIVDRSIIAEHELSDYS